MKCWVFFLCSIIVSRLSCELSSPRRPDRHPQLTLTSVCVLSLLRQHLLVHVARANGYTKVMLGDSCTRVAVKLLANISLGRGAHLAQDTVRSGLWIRSLAPLKSNWMAEERKLCVCVLTGVLRLQVW